MDFNNITGTRDWRGRPNLNGTTPTELVGTVFVVERTKY